MNSDHALGAIGGGAGAILSITQVADLIAFYQHVPANIANDEASIILVIIATIGALVARWLKPASPSQPQGDQPHA